MMTAVETRIVIRDQRLDFWRDDCLRKVALVNAVTLLANRIEARHIIVVRVEGPCSAAPASSSW
jgi:hypothetical protein